MTIRTFKVNIVLLSCLTVALLIGLPALRAQDASDSPSVSPSVKAKVQELAKLAPKARRAELAKLSKDERRAIWFELKREEMGDQKLATKGDGVTVRKHAAKAGTAVRPKVEPPQQLVGSIVYDDGVGTVTVAGSNRIMGNRFNTAVGDPVLSSGTVSTVVAVVRQGTAFTTSSAGFVLEGPQTGSGGAMAIFSTFTGGSGGPTDTVTFNGLGVNYPGSSFFVLFGAFNNSYVPVFGTGTTQSQGHHGVVGFTGGMGPNVTTITTLGGTLNALVRVTGNVLPVELMSFDVEN